jgi:hypothetical protein
MQNASFLFATGYLACLCLPSHLVPFNDKSTAEDVGISRHRNFAVFSHEHLVAIRVIGSPGAVEIECVGRKIEFDTKRTKERSNY